MPYPLTKPDPVKDAADQLHDTLKGKPRDVGYVFREKAGGDLQPIGSDGCAKKVVDVVKGLTPTQQGDAFKQYNDKPGRTHNISSDKGKENHQEITIEPKISKLTFG